MWSTDSIRRCAGGCVGARCDSSTSAGPPCSVAVPSDGCPFPHRTRVALTTAAPPGRVPIFRALPKGALQELEGTMQLVSFVNPGHVLRQVPCWAAGTCAPRAPASLRMRGCPCCRVRVTCHKHVQNKHMYPLSARRASELLACCSSLPGRCKSADRQSGLADTPAWSRSYSWCSTLGAASLIARKPWCRRMSSACRRPRACSCPSRTCHKICP